MGTFARCYFSPCVWVCVSACVYVCMCRLRAPVAAPIRWVSRWADLFVGGAAGWRGEREGGGGCREVVTVLVCSDRARLCLPPHSPLTSDTAVCAGCREKLLCYCYGLFTVDAVLHTWVAASCCGEKEACAKHKLLLVGGFMRGHWRDSVSCSTCPLCLCPPPDSCVSLRLLCLLVLCVLVEEEEGAWDSYHPIRTSVPLSLNWVCKI